MKNILIITLSSLLFIACNSSGTTSNSIPITEKCNSENDITNYQTLQSGDEIGQEETLNQLSTAPAVEIFHTASGDKKVCINSGTAMIYR